MAIQESDYMDFGNGIIGDDTFDVWRKKTNRIKIDLDYVNATLTAKINTDIANLSTVYIPQAGSATSVSTALQFTSPITFASNVLIGDSTLTSSSNKLNIDKEVDSSVQLTSTKVRAKNNLILGDKTYNVPSSPAINNAVLVAQTNGTLSWQNVASIFQLSGGLTQTTTVFEEVMPVGSVIPLAAETNDTNYLLCEGSLVPGGKNGEYRDLWDVIGYTYGGSGNDFRLPDYRGRVAVGTGGTSVTFPTSFGVTGGTDTRSTSGHDLTIEQIPRHSHTLNTDANYGYKDSISQPAKYITGQSETSPIGPADSTLNDQNYINTSGGGLAHSHNITAENRVQPYITVKWYIKAKKNTKINFKIDIANSGLKSTTFGGQPQTLISPVNETIQLDIDPDNKSIALDNNYKVSIKSSPTIQGPITVVSGEPTQSNHLTTKNYVDNTYQPGEIIESFSALCNGRNVTLRSGTYTMPNVTGQHDVNPAHAGAVDNALTRYLGDISVPYLKDAAHADYTYDVTGSLIRYKLPTNATRVKYTFTYNWSHIYAYANPLFYFTPFIGGGEGTTSVDETWTRLTELAVTAGEYDSYEGQNASSIYLEITDNAQEEDVEKGIIYRGNWPSSGRSLLWNVGLYSASHPVRLYSNYHYQRSFGAVAWIKFIPPSIEITAFA